MTPRMKPPAADGARVRALRHAAGLTRDQLAYLAEIGTATVTRIENGHGRHNRTTIAAIARVLDVDPADLLREAAPW